MIQTLQASLLVLLGVGLTHSKIVHKAFLGGKAWQGQAAVMTAFQASRSKKGGFVPNMLVDMVGIPITGFASVGLSLVPGISTLGGIIIGGMIANYAEDRFGAAMVGKVRLFTDLNKRVRHLEMGGSYQDTELNQRQRFLAIQDMNATMVNSRRYLGQEALLMHR